MSSRLSIPLLRDNHNHFIIYALLGECLDIAAVQDKTRALKLLFDLPGDKISIVLGWNSGYYSLSEEDLKTLPPLIILNLSLHSLCMSRKAEEQLSPDYPEIVHNYANSLWYEQNFSRIIIMITKFIQPSLEKFKQFYTYLKGRGIYHVEEMLLPSQQIFDLVSNSELKDKTAFWADLATFKNLNQKTRNSLKGIKFFTDGALGAYTAAMKEPYKNGKKGILLFRDEELFIQLKEAGDYAKAISVHAIGEEANSQAVRVIKELVKAGITFPRVRLEHCQFISEEGAKTAGELGIILSMQPNFNTDNYYYTDRLTEYQLKGNNPFRMLIDKAGFKPGKNLIFGSDGMPHGAQAALSSALFPLLKNQKLSLQEFVSGYCLENEEKGRINLEITDNAVKVLSVRV